VSLLSPESLSIFFSPTELVAVHWRGRRPRIAGKRIYAVSATPGRAWEGAVAASAELLRDFPTCRRVRVILSGHFTSLQLLPWRDDLNDRDEELAIARLAFTQTYGEAAGNWQIRLTDAAPGVTRVAAALDADLLATLEQLAGASKARITSIEPYLVAAANEWRGHFNRDFAAWLIVHEEGRLGMAFIDRGNWRWLRSVRVDDHWCESLPDQLDTEAMLAGVDNLPAQALIFSPASPELTLRAGTPWSLRSLALAARANFSPVSDSRFGLALVG